MQYRFRAGGYSRPFFPNGVKWLLISNVVIFLVDFFAHVWFDAAPFTFFTLIPAYVLRYGMVWQLVTYAFLHAGVWHILINMLVLWMFGMELEQLWGTRRFLKFYFICGIGAGVCVVLVAMLRTSEAMIPTLGASGAIFGLLLAYGVLFPDRIILFMLVIPMKAKYAVMIFGAIAFLGSWQPGGGVSHVAHLGGMVIGYVYLKWRLMRAPFHPLSAIRRQIQEWKLQRARRKFQVYMRKQQSGRDRWVN